ncbi:cation diffusion facilitator family transporter [archaeon]|nr:MAG: cation diffusion facilitator family transporter [archaeon]
MSSLSAELLVPSPTHAADVHVNMEAEESPVAPASLPPIPQADASVEAAPESGSVTHAAGTGMVASGDHVSVLPAGEDAGGAAVAGSVAVAGSAAVDAVSALKPAWRHDVAMFERGRVDPHSVTGDRKKRKRVVRFYRAQNELIDKFESLAAQMTAREAGAPPPATTAADTEETTLSVKLAINLSFLGNILLFGVKIFAAAYSGSLAVVGSAIDSSLDLMSGSILFVAARIAAKRNPYKYPVGKTRLEPLAIIVFASVMGVAALQLVVQSIQVIAQGVSEGPPKLTIDAVTYGVLGSTVAVKLLLLILCWRLRDESDSVEALVQDHRNDVITNAATIVSVALASRFKSVWWLDPGMAMALALLIVVTWTLTGRGMCDLHTRVHCWPGSARTNTARTCCVRTSLWSLQTTSFS